MTELLSSEWVFLALFVFAVLDGFFPPMPSETAIIALAAAWSAGDGQPLPLIILIAAAGAFAGDQLTYNVGRGLARRRLRRRPGGLRGLARAQTLIADHGGPALLAARFIPGGRVAATTAAGVLGFPRAAYAAWTGGGAVAWAAYYAAIGSVTGAWLRGNTLLAVIIGVAGGMLLGYVANAVVRRARSSPNRADDDPAPAASPSP
jgi:membrane protein DedA with SNARE-associated domain